MYTFYLPSRMDRLYWTRVVQSAVAKLVAGSVYYADVTAADCAGPLRREHLHGAGAYHRVGGWRVARYD